MTYRSTALLGLVLLCGGCSTAWYSMKSAAHVVVPARQLPGTYGKSGWSPTEAQIADCETAIARALARRGRDLGNYYLRMGGVIRDGSRRIEGIAADINTGKGYLLPPSDETNARSRSEGETIVLPAFGGGEAFFSFEYDADRRKVVRLEFNAPL